MASDTFSDTLDALLKLPASDRIELAMALWESVSEAERDTQFPITDEQKAELDRRWKHYLAHPERAVPRDVARERLMNRRK